jgi:hypothetical protein
MVRGWHVEGLAVRRITGWRAHGLPHHGAPPRTGRDAARRAPRGEEAELRRRGRRTLDARRRGRREITDKNLRKRVREAQRAAGGARLAAPATRAEEPKGRIRPHRLERVRKTAAALITLGLAALALAGCSAGPSSPDRPARRSRNRPASPTP